MLTMNSNPKYTKNLIYPQKTYFIDKIRILLTFLN